MMPTATWQIASHSVSIAHLEWLYWLEDGGNDVTKGDMLRYYRSMAPVLLPYLNPLTRLPIGAA